LKCGLDCSTPSGTDVLVLDLVAQCPQEATALVTTCSEKCQVAWDAIWVQCLQPNWQSLLGRFPSLAFIRRTCAHVGCNANVDDDATHLVASCPTVVHNLSRACSGLCRFEWEVMYAPCIVPVFQTMSTAVRDSLTPVITACAARTDAPSALPTRSPTGTPSLEPCDRLSEVVPIVNNITEACALLASGSTRQCDRTCLAEWTRWYHGCLEPQWGGLPKQAQLLSIRASCELITCSPLACSPCSNLDQCSEFVNCHWSDGMCKECIDLDDRCKKWAADGLCNVRAVATVPGNPVNLSIACAASCSRCLPRAFNASSVLANQTTASGDQTGVLAIGRCNSMLATCLKASSLNGATTGSICACAQSSVYCLEPTIAVAAVADRTRLLAQEFPICSLQLPLFAACQVNQILSMARGCETDPITTKWTVCSDACRSDLQRMVQKHGCCVSRVLTEALRVSAATPYPEMRAVCKLDDPCLPTAAPSMTPTVTPAPMVSVPTGPCYNVPNAAYCSVVASAEKVLCLDKLGVPFFCKFDCDSAPDFAYCRTSPTGDANQACRYVCQCVSWWHLKFGRPTN
jgi:hypothetical protein